MGKGLVKIGGAVFLLVWGLAPDVAGQEAADVAASGGVAGLIGPDVIVSLIHTAGVQNYGRQDPSGTGDFISAFAVGTTSCNIGDLDLDWFPSPGSNQHPVIHQSLYRLKNHRFEQIGMSWLKHGFYALNEERDCSASCSRANQGAQTLYVGCSDPYTGSLNGSRTYLGPTWEVNADTGYFPAAHTGASGTEAIPHRLQVHDVDLDASLNPGATYFVQGFYVHPDDATFVHSDDSVGNGSNNASYSRATVTWSPTYPQGARYVLQMQGATQIGEEAIRAWQDADPTVTETDVQVPDEGLFILAAKAIEQGSGFWRYEYALQNLNSDRSGGAFSVPLPSGVIIQNAGFHDVDYHDGDGVECRECTCAGGDNDGLACGRAEDCPGGACPERAGVACHVCTCAGGPNDDLACDSPGHCPGGKCGAGPHLNFDGTDWEITISPGTIEWATTPYTENRNANALRWGTLYNFYFEANIGPTDTTVHLGLFKPGFPSEVAIGTKGPGLTMIDCNENGVPDSCDVDCDTIGCEPPCGSSLDCSANGVPDECEADCNANDIPDFCDIRDGTSEDCQPNTVPDECEPDCDNDGTIDACEAVLDTDGDGVEDCDDLCPETTPAGACLPPYDQIVNCCFSNGLIYGLFTWAQCVDFCDNPPNTPETCGPVCDDAPMCPGTRCAESFCRDGCLMGDFDEDGDLDLADVAMMEVCFSGATSNPAFVTPSAECLLRFDYEPDGDVDVLDYDAFHDNFAGP